MNDTCSRQAAVSVCFKFSQLCFCQILFELVYGWESYHEIKRLNFFTRHSVCKLRTLQTRVAYIYERLRYGALSMFRLHDVR